MIYNEHIELIRAALNNKHNIGFEDEKDLITGNKQLIKAAVLIAITNQKEPTIILTKRPDWLRSHAGQVAFPGGKMDDDDPDIQHTAMREAHEELSIDPNNVDIIATCPEYSSGSGYNITPVIAVIPADIEIKPNPEEVDAYFTVPMAFLFDCKNALQKSAIWGGKERSYYDMQWKNYRIWGVTAGIIANLARNIENYKNDR